MEMTSKFVQRLAVATRTTPPPPLFAGRLYLDCGEARVTSKRRGGVTRLLHLTGNVGDGSLGISKDAALMALKLEKRKDGVRVLTLSRETSGGKSVPTASVELTEADVPHVMSALMF